MEQQINLSLSLPPLKSINFRVTSHATERLALINLLATQSQHNPSHSISKAAAHVPCMLPEASLLMMVRNTLSRSGLQAKFRSSRELVSLGHTFDSQKQVDYFPPVSPFRHN